MIGLQIEQEKETHTENVLKEMIYQKGDDSTLRNVSWPIDHRIEHEQTVCRFERETCATYPAFSIHFLCITPRLTFNIQTTHIRALHQTNKHVIFQTTVLNFRHVYPIPHAASHPDEMEVNY